MFKGHASKHNRKSKETKQFPVRFVFMSVAVIAVIAALPLMTVWRKAYINSSSVNQKSLADSVAVLSEKVTMLRLCLAELSTNERIERLAGEWLSLEYPSADRIVIVDRRMNPVQEKTAGVLNGWKFLAVLRRSLDRGRG